MASERIAGGSSVADDLTAAGIGYGAHRLIQSQGGYRKVGQAAAGAGGAVLKGRMATAIRKAMINAARRAGR